ncbi:MAG TPA: hypothetical protein DEF42_15890 [Desulfosporosinus sp.]|nr:hypothetical protein [Desulfosporosinus sp.]
MVQIWGVNPGTTIANENKWLRIKSGDIVLFSANKRIFSSGIVTDKLHNKNLAKELWGMNDDNQTWEYIYFLKDINEQNIEITEFNQAVGYASNYVIQGFSVLDGEKSAKAIEDLGLIQNMIPLKIYQENLEKKIKHSRNITRQERLNRLGRSNKLPKIIQTMSNQYQRNPDVIVEVLLRANGNCEKCGNPASFMRASDGSPYLEVHHKIFLSEGGEDTVDNAIALCPNCHREVHFG